MVNLGYIICVFARRIVLTRYKVKLIVNVGTLCWMLDVTRWYHRIMVLLCNTDKNVKNVINRFYRGELKTDVVLLCTV